MIKGSEILLEELADKELLSTRCVNMCIDNGLTSLDKILNFYNLDKSFKSIRNCGEKTNNELIDLCVKYFTYIVYTEEDITLDFEDDNKNAFLSKIDLLNPFQKSILNRYIEYLGSNLKKCDTRSYNALINVVGTDNLSGIYQKIFEKDFNFKGIKNIGDKSTKHLEIFKVQIWELINKLTFLKKEELVKEYVKLFIQMTFPKFNESFEDIFDANGKIKIFKLIDLIVNGDYIYLDKRKSVFVLLYSNSSDKPLKNIDYLTAIGADAKLTRERIRQIKVNVKESIQPDLAFISNFLLSDLVYYGIKDSDIYQIINNSYAEGINKIESVNFNAIFYTEIWSIILKKSYFGLKVNEILREAVKLKRLNKSRSYNCYLIHLLLNEYFDFEAFVKDIDSKINYDIIETYKLHFKGYLLEFIKKDGKAIFGEILVVCEAILFNEFDLIVDMDGYINFEQNTIKLMYQYYYEILVANGNLMTVSEISAEANIKFCGLESTPQSVRGILGGKKNLFVYFGRTSTYGLVEWENENIKGGTIRDLVEDYLKNYEEPKHISEITEYVKQYREKTNEISIFGNIQLDTSKKFILYGSSFIGLKENNYSLEATKIKRMAGTRFTNRTLKKYDNWLFDDVVEDYVKKYNYKSIQVTSRLKKQIDAGIISLNHENRLIIKKRIIIYE